ncbi:hypothetical protein [Dysgonomonas sp. 25]|uniref:hypothetical protein n=1 Tax=Dysgonomonas sp. 25 TaxID=2302933 RepID=UPI0013D0D485|nr:hypothetical protein [Dysgonomonas sp. 25]NDV69986.1 hypothetical protein [Dysgonomonas sp. 25]
MGQRYIYEEKQKPGHNTSGFGIIRDTCPDKPWNDEIATIFGNKNVQKMQDALNLYEDLSKLKKNSTKKQILSVFAKYNIKL